MLKIQLLLSLNVAWIWLSICIGGMVCNPIRSEGTSGRIGIIPLDLVINQGGHEVVIVANGFYALILQLREQGVRRVVWTQIRLGAC